MSYVPYDHREITLASAILQGLVARGEFGDGPFDRFQEWEPTPDGRMDARDLKMNPQFSARLLSLVTVSLTSARCGLALTENRAMIDMDDEDDDE